MSLPEPLIGCSEVLDGNPALWNLDTGHYPDNTQDGPSDLDDVTALVSSIHNRPQGAMLRALCDSLIPVFRDWPQITQDLISDLFSELLTRKGVSSV